MYKLFWLIVFIVFSFSAFASVELDKDIELAGLGNAGAEFRLGARYLNGIDVEIDYERALHWLNKAAEKEHANALFNLGYMYLYGVGVGIDYVKSFGYFERSSKGGFLPSMHMLGLMYYDGAGVRKDTQKAYEYCKMAADNGYEPAKKIIDEDNKTIRPKSAK